MNKPSNDFENQPSQAISRKPASKWPRNLVIGITLETNRDSGYGRISKAPPPSRRYKDFLAIDHPVKMVTIEPVLKSDPEVMVEWMKELKTCTIWLGYDSKNTGLPEPTIEEFRELHWALGREGFPVVLKKAYPGKANKRKSDDIRKDNMYLASVRQVSPFVGCEHNCIYCVKSFQRVLKRQGKEKCPDCYNFNPHYSHFESRLKRFKFKSTRFGEFNFMCQMGDICFCDDEHFWQLIDFIKKNSDRIFLLQTKDPKKAFIRKRRLTPTANTKDE